MPVHKVVKSRITKDGRKYYYSFTINKKRYVSKLFKTKLQAEKAEQEHKILLKLEEKKIKEKKQKKVKTVTFKELYDELYNYKLDKVKQTTLYSYRNRIIFFEMFYNVPIDQIDTNKYLVWRSYMVKQGLSIGTLNGILKMFKEILNYAYKWHDINNRSLYNRLENFIDADTLPKEMSFFTIEEFKQFESNINNIRDLCLFELLFYCGLRRGELLGLTWQNIELNKKLIHIKNNVVAPHDGKDIWVMTSPKNRSSIRTIPLPTILTEHLRKYYKELKKENNNFNTSWFISEGIKPLSPRTLDYRKNLYIKKANLKYIRIHDFRHSCASLLINNGANVLIVAKYLGHAKLEETLNTYSHLYDDKLSEITELLNKLDI